MLIYRTDPFTNEDHVLDVDITAEEYASWQQGALIQNAFPRLNADEREYMMTGMWEGSWDKYVARDDEEGEG